MNNKVKQMIKNVIEENAVEFKQNTSNAIYEKLNHRLSEEYINVSKNFLRINEDVDDVVSAGYSSLKPDESAAISFGKGGAGSGGGKPPAGPSGKPGSKPGTGATKPSEPKPKPDQTPDEWQQEHKIPQIKDYPNEDEWLKALKEYWQQLEDLKSKWRDWQKGQGISQTSDKYKSIPWQIFYKNVYNRQQGQKPGSGNKS